MPDSHQEANAEALYKQGASVVLDQSGIEPEVLVKAIRKILFDPILQQKIKKGIASVMPHDATEKMLTIIKALSQ